MTLTDKATTGLAALIGGLIIVALAGNVDEDAPVRTAAQNAKNLAADKGGTDLDFAGGTSEPQVEVDPVNAAGVGNPSTITSVRAVQNAAGPEDSVEQVKQRLKETQDFRGDFEVQTTDGGGDGGGGGGGLLSR